jgi:hypothetical protein
VPEDIDPGFTVRDSGGVTGVKLAASVNPQNTGDLYLNAMAADSELVFSGDIIKAESVTGDSAPVGLTVKDGGFTIVPKPIDPQNGLGQVIRITLAGGGEYTVILLPETIADMTITINGQPRPGVYTVCIDQYLICLDTDGRIAYYRNLACMGGAITANFQPHETPDGLFFTDFAELDADARGENGRFAAGMFVVMDAGFREINYLTLLENQDSPFRHGNGYLDFHELILFSENHYIALGSPASGDESVPVIQEVQNGAVLREFSVPGYMINSVTVDPEDGGLVVTMASPYAVYKLDRETGELLWILGGKDNQFSGLNGLADWQGNTFNNPTGAVLSGDSASGRQLLLFDVHTNVNGDYSRIITFTLDETEKTAAYTMINCFEDLDVNNTHFHWPTDFGSVSPLSENSLVAGFGYNSTLDHNNKKTIRHSVFSDYDPINHVILYELRVSRSPLYVSELGCFSFRAYKTIS